MEKDISKSNGQINNINNSNGVSNKIKRTSNQGLFMSVSKKAEKLTTALYMLTDLIKENDPMRYKIRQTSIAVLSETRGLSYALTGDLYFHLARVISKSWEIVSLIEVCVVVGFISDMNYGVLKNALIDFISDLRNRQKVEGFSQIQDLKIGVGEANNFKLKNDFFKLNQEDFAQIMKEEKLEETTGSVKEKLENKDIRVETKTKKSANITINQNNPKTKLAKRSTGGKQNGRSQKILELVHNKRDISIKDIVSYFKEYSQKTIQRDLAKLVEEGKIKREGEKRWSRYSI